MDHARSTRVDWSVFGLEIELRVVAEDALLVEGQAAFGGQVSGEARARLAELGGAEHEAGATEAAP